MKVTIAFTGHLFFLKNFHSFVFFSSSADLIPHSYRTQNCREHSGANIFFFIYFCQKIIRFVSGWWISLSLEKPWDIIYILGIQKLYQFVPSLSFLTRIAQTGEGGVCRTRLLHKDMSTYDLLKEDISILGLPSCLSIIVSTFVLWSNVFLPHPSLVFLMISERHKFDFRWYHLWLSIM